MTASDGPGARHDEPEVREEDAWWLRERAAVPPPTEAPPVVEPSTPVEPPLTPPPPVASQRSRPGPRDVPVVAPATMPPSAAPERPRRDRRRRLVVLAAVLALVLIGLAAALVVQKGNDETEVATKGDGSRGTVTTAASATTGAPAGGASNGESVTVNTDVLFDVGSSQLTAAAASSRLGNVLSLAQTDPNRHVLVEGFTDSDGDRTLNQQLSEARAQAVAQWLIGQGIDSARISAVGHGADNPVAPNDTPENKALNRRVVVALQS